MQAYLQPMRDSSPARGGAGAAWRRAGSRQRPRLFHRFERNCRRCPAARLVPPLGPIGSAHSVAQSVRGGRRGCRSWLLARAGWAKGRQVCAKVQSRLPGAPASKGAPGARAAVMLRHSGACGSLRTDVWLAPRRPTRGCALRAGGASSAYGGELLVMMQQFLAAGRRTIIDAAKARASVWARSRRLSARGRGARVQEQP